MKRRAVGSLLVAAAVASVAGCASVEEFARGVPARVESATTSVKYTLAGSTVSHRESLERGLDALKVGDHQLALRSLRRATWDLERIDKRRLRLEELASAHRAVAEAYGGLGKTELAQERLALSTALAEAARGADDPDSAQRSLARAKAAYRAARFSEAVAALDRALVELEEMTHAPARVASLEEARCYMAFANFALDQEERVREEIWQLAALDGGLASCRQHAPPAVQSLIRDVQLGEVRAGRRSVP